MFLPEGAWKPVSSKYSRSLVARKTSSKSFVYCRYDDDDNDDNALPMMKECICCWSSKVGGWGST